MSRSAITTRIRNAHPDHRAIARGMLIGSVFVFLSKLAGAAKEMAVAWRYGVSEVVDAYLFIFNLLNWPVVVWFSDLSVVVIPLAATIRERSPRDLPRFRAELLGLTLLLGLALALLAQFGLPILLRLSFSGLSGSALTYAISIAPALAWVGFFGMLISLLSAWVMAVGSHSNTLLDGIPALVILVVLLITSGTGTAPLVWGTLAGLTIHLGILSASL